MYKNLLLEERLYKKRVFVAQQLVCVEHFSTCKNFVIVDDRSPDKTISQGMFEKSFRV